MNCVNFNVENPTKENIEYAFKNLLYYLNASSCLDIYKDYRTRFEHVLIKVKDILKQYINNGNLKVLKEDVLQDIKFDLIDLNVKTQALQSYYAEWSLLWIGAIMSLRISEINNL